MFSTIMNILTTYKLFIRLIVQTTCLLICKSTIIKKTTTKYIIKFITISTAITKLILIFKIMIGITIIKFSQSSIRFLIKSI